MEKKLDGNYTRMLRAILNNSLRQHPTKQQLYGHLPRIMKTINIRRNKHAGHCWRSRNDLISDVLLWTPSHSNINLEMNFQFSKWLSRLLIKENGSRIGTESPWLFIYLFVTPPWQCPLFTIFSGLSSWCNG